VANERLAAYERRIAERGLKIDRFDGTTLFLTYDAANDAELRGRQAFEVADIRVFAIQALNADAGPPLFLGIKGIKI
jgi:hypothetical protein